MKRFPLALAAAAAWLATTIASTRADVRLPALFSDGMVLQQGVKVPIWGWAEDGEAVTVEFLGQKVSATAKDGKWKATLESLKAGGPHEMKIAGKNSISLKNVLVGEVWVCGGQSNMALAAQSVENAEEEIAKSANPMIRLFKVAQQAADEPQSDVKAQWQECGPQTVGAFSAAGYFFGRDLAKARNVPVGLIQSCIGGTNATSWTSRAALAGDPITKKAVEAYEEALKKYPQAKAAAEKQLQAWQESVKKAKAEGQSPPKKPRNLLFGPMGPDNPKRPSALYYGMISPLQPYAIKGAIWYQGEANAGDAAQYRKLFPAMIQNWRADWGQGDFPFLFVQLPGFNKAKGQNWPALREAQLMTLSLKNTGMAVAIDVGDPDNIHPKKKQPVGERLALAARAIAYGEKIVYSGPIYSSMKVEDGKAVLSFNHVGGGLEARGGALKGFVIAGDERQFVEAKAQIVGDTVVVSNAQVAKPAAVRYAWAPVPDCNLYNKEGLPASPFRTDDWPLEEK